MRARFFGARSGRAAGCFSRLNRALILAVAATIAGCSSSILLKPNPRMSSGSPPVQEAPTSKPTAEAPVPVDTPAAAVPVRSEDSTSFGGTIDESPDLDFAVAFAESSSQGSPAPLQATAEPPSPAPVPQPPAAAPSAAPAPAGRIGISSRQIRVALRRNLARISLYSAGAVSIGSPGLDSRLPARGRITIHAAQTARAVRIDAGPKRSRQFALPCTLLTADGSGVVDLDEGSFRGSIIVVAQPGGRFMVVNLIDLEDYLRGVIDLEIGARPPGEIEAVKAQAVAARTYACKRMLDRRADPFDVLATVEDQVYGGVAAESRQSDRAVRETAGMVLAFGDSLVNAYYHSTCGGTTANVNDVWEKPAAPCLVSIRDADPSGTAYCSMSSYFRWTETWSSAQLAGILSRTLAGQGCGGSVSDIRVDARFDCGRVRTCRIVTSGGECRTGGDAARFILRRADAERSILRSANFSVAAVSSREVRITGAGYGHGVGMCQMGAVGRARAGQTCEEILTAYYRGARIARITPGNATR